MRKRISDSTRPGVVIVIDTPGPTTEYLGDKDHCIGGSGYKAITDEVTSNYKKLKNEGKIINKPCSIISRKWTGGQVITFDMGPHPGWGTRRITGHLDALRMRLPNMPPHIALDQERARSIQMTEAYSKMNKAEFQSTVFAAELGKTLEMMRSPLAGARKHLGKYESSVKRQLKLDPNVASGLLYGIRTERAAKAWANAHLELIFGWKPLVHDIQDSFKALSAAGVPRFPSLQVARARWAGGYSYSEVHNAPSLMGMTDWTDYGDYLCKVTCNAGVLYTIDHPNQTSVMQQAFGLGASDILPSAWELVRLSWLVDYFVNVGSWLQSAVLRPEIKVHSDFCVEQELWSSKHRSNGSATVQFSGGARKYDLWTPGIEYSSSRYTRSVNLGRPLLPSIHPDTLGLNRLLNVLALGIQSFKDFKASAKAMRL